MTERHGKRVGGICSGLARKSQQLLDHQLHLLLLRGASAHDSKLDLPGSIFVDPRLPGERATQGRAARLSQLEGAVRVAMHEHPLDGDFLGLELTDQTGHASKNLLQALWKGIAVSPDRTAGNVACDRAAAFDHRVARCAGTGIEPEHPDPLSRCHGQDDRRRSAGCSDDGNDRSPPGTTPRQ